MLYFLLVEPVLFFNIVPHKNELFSIVQHNSSYQIRNNSGFILLTLSLYHFLCFLQSLLTGLMYYQPDDPIDYLEGCLKKARELGGPDKVRWDTFVAHEKKPLPPLNGGQTRRSLFRNGG